MKNVTTIILAAGKSTRIQSNKSKIFHEIAGRSLIEYVYEIAYKISQNKVIFVCNNTNINKISEQFPKAKVVLQKKLIGTADAIMSSKKILNKNDNILILFGDSPLIEKKTVSKMIKNFKLLKKSGSVLVFKSKNPTGYGRVETLNSRIKKVTEEIYANETIKKINLCNSGVMICNQKFLFDNLIKIKNTNLKKEKYITDIFEVAYKLNKPFSYSICNENELLGANSRQQLIDLDFILQNKIKDSLIKSGVTIYQPETVRVSYDTKVGKDTIIEPNVNIRKGVIIKNNVTVKSNTVLEGCIVDNESILGPSANIRPFTKIGKKVKVGNFVEIKNSIIGDASAVSHLSYIGDSSIGKKVNIGAGTITCNYDGKKKHQTVIKNNVFVGSNTSLLAPLYIGQNSIIGAGSVITKNVAPNTLAVGRSKQKNRKIIKKYNK